jgi:hypothetical protein
MLAVVVVWLQLLISQTARGQEDGTSENVKKLQTERKTVTLQILDADGEPIEGASLKPLHMICATGSTGWIDPEPEKVENLLSDSSGKLVFSYPAQRQDNNLLLIDAELTHPDFISESIRMRTDDASITCRLERGFRIALNAIDAGTEKPILDGLAVALDHKEWSLSPSGYLVSPWLPPRSRDENASRISESGYNRFRVVQIVDGQAIRFSDLIEVEDKAGTRVRLKDVKMYDAVRLVGKLDDSVPRPITNGMIGACVAWLPENLDEQLPRAFCWDTVCEIKPDGSFDLGGFPRDATVQIIAECDGWFSRSATKLEIRTTFAHERTDLFPPSTLFPQLVRTGNVNCQEIVVSMVPACRLTVTICDEEDRPVADAKAFINKTRIDFLGVMWWVRPSPAERLLAASKGEVMPHEGENDVKRLYLSAGYSFQWQADSEGKIELLNLPGGSLRLSVHAKGYLPLTHDDPEARVLLSNDKANEVKIQLKKSTKPDKSD